GGSPVAPRRPTGPHGRHRPAAPRCRAAGGAAHRGDRLRHAEQRLGGHALPRRPGLRAARRL
ncbi:MAG: hypothetical protein AVDCRST_MAG27-2739, partial [uncultured Craurococcus sp.]